MKIFAKLGLILTITALVQGKISTKQGDVYLVGGADSNEGNVFAVNPTTGIDGPVCDDLWDNADGDVVCRQLGFSGAAQIFTGSQFGEVAEPFSFDNVECTGSEDALADCQHETSSNCLSNEGAGVQCENGGGSSTTTAGPGTDIELVGGSSATEGNVFATNPNTGIHGPVCDDGWELIQADIVCKQLGFRGALEFTTNSFFGDVPEEFAFDDVICSGSEDTLQDCTYADFSNCFSTEGAGVKCDESGGVSTTTSGPTVGPTQIELVGGSTAGEGNVFATNPNTGFHGPVCDDIWTQTEADVVCRQLGFSGAIEATSASTFGDVPDEYAFDDVTCTGDENTLQDCTFSDIDNCGPNEGAGVRCEEGGVSTSTTEGPSSDIELVGGSNPGEGNVFATNPNTGLHGPVCDDIWTQNEADVVCRQLGFSGAIEATIESAFGDVPDEYAFDDVTCTGNENALTECTFSDVENCGPNEAAGVRCQGGSVSTTTSEPGPSEISLVGGSSDNEGNVFATNPATGVFGPVCDDGWNLDAANVVCRQLGYTGAERETTGSFFGEVPDEHSYDDIACTGNEDTLDDCQHADVENCNVFEGAGVVCQV